jgi:hypothetical protein
VPPTHSRFALFPLIALILLGGCSPTVGAQRASTPPGSRVRATASRAIPVRRLRPDRATFEYYSGIGDSLRSVIGDEHHWREVWVRIHRDERPIPPVPAIDWSRELVVVAALGRRSSGGFDIRIDSAYQRNDTLEIVVRTDVPGRNCMLTAAFSQPVDLARLPRPAATLPVHFRESTHAEPCD